MQVKSLYNFRSNLRFALEIRGLSQRALAEKARLSHPYINRILVGKVEPSLPMCDVLADAVGFDLSEMVSSPKEFKKLHENEVATN